MLSKILDNVILAPSFIVIFLSFISQFHSDFLSSQYFCSIKSVVLYLLLISFLFSILRPLFVLSALVL